MNYEAWRATHQDAEAAAKAAFEQVQGLAKMVDGLQGALGRQVRFGSEAGNPASGAQDKMPQTQQPEALRLAELIRLSGALPGSVSDDAASELRRLHAENQDLRTRHYCNTAEIESLQHRVQELGEMARENRSKRVIELEQRIAEMEEQMAAIGAGGVEPLRKRAVEEGGEDTLTMAAAIIMQREADARDAARYRWLRNQMIGVDFDWFGNGITALVFEVPDGFAYSRNCDQNIDAAVAVQAKQGEKK